MRMLRKMALLTFTIALLLASTSSFAAEKGFQELLYERAPQSEWATISLSCWSDFADNRFPPTEQVVGSGFLVNDEGYFVTAAHVVKTDHVGSDAAQIPCKLKAVVRQADGNSGAMGFDIIEVDEGHDLALCRILGFKVYDEQHPSHLDKGTPKSSWHPFSSLAVATSEVRQGELVLLSGFPLGSWTQALHLGLISSTIMVNPNVPIPTVTKDRNQLVPVTINGNHGDSGGPLIDVTTGQVVGVLLQIVPAPMAIGGRVVWDSGTFELSGIMLAAPATWVNALLSRHNVRSHSEAPGKLHIW